MNVIQMASNNAIEELGSGWTITKEDDSSSHYFLEASRNGDAIFVKVEDKTIYISVEVQGRESEEDCYGDVLSVYHSYDYLYNLIRRSLVKMKLELPGALY